MNIARPRACAPAFPPTARQNPPVHTSTPTRPTRPSHQSNTKLRYGGIAAAVVGLTLLCAVSLSANDGVGSDLTPSNSALGQLNTLTLDQEGASNGAALGLNLDKERSTGWGGMRFARDTRA